MHGHSETTDYALQSHAVIASTEKIQNGSLLSHHCICSFQYLEVWSKR